MPRKKRPGSTIKLFEAELGKKPGKPYFNISKPQAKIYFEKAAEATKKKSLARILLMDFQGAKIVASIRGNLPQIPAIALAIELSIPLQVKNFMDLLAWS